MALAAGSRLGPYEILAPLGAGGMGEVYRARDKQDILAIHDFGSQDGIDYAVMELLEGETLRGKLDAGPIPQKQAVDYAL